MTPVQLLEQLRSAERWTRYQAKRLLFDAPRDLVLPAAAAFVAQVPSGTSEGERLLLEVAGVFEAHEAPHLELLKRLLDAKDARVRAYGARVAGGWSDRLPECATLLRERVQDAHPRVRLEAVVAASYVPKADAVEIVAAAVDLPRDPFLDYAIRQSARASQGRWAAAFGSNQLKLGSAGQTDYLKKLLGTPPKQATPGETLYEMACLPCHQPEGKGLPGVYPPLRGSEWVQGDPTRLIKIVLHGLSGPVTVGGQVFGGPGAVPMPALGGLTDEQIADVLTFVRSAFGGGAPAVTVSEVESVRAATRQREAAWTAEELKR